jgi:hypothetical protein
MEILSMETTLCETESASQAAKNYENRNKTMKLLIACLNRYVECILVNFEVGIIIKM